MAKKLVSSLVAQIQQLEKNAHLVDLAMKALPLEKRVQLFKEWIPTSTVPYKSLLRIMHLTKKDVQQPSNGDSEYIVYLSGLGYIDSSPTDSPVFTKSRKNATRYKTLEELNEILQYLKDDGWDAKSTSVQLVTAKG